MKEDDQKKFPKLAEEQAPEAKVVNNLAMLDPHFFSNTLNAIEGLVNLEQNRAASKYLIHFSRLTRRLMSIEPGSMTSLAEELATIKNFLALEQLRFKDKLYYEITVNPAINSRMIQLPAIVFQAYLEKAIWCGLKPKTGPGWLRINIDRKENELHCVIEDDGIGREAARQQQAASLLQPSSAWPKISAEKMQEFGEVKAEIIDLLDEEGRAKGTRVLLRLPYKTLLV
jgi:LytS/YehU family sensor histidine kinase